MADARRESLPLTGGGLEHDWEVLFTHWNLMLHDQQIGHSMVILGWLGMLASVLWFAYRALRGSSQASACEFFLLRK
jgi:hypothetical protein